MIRYILKRVALLVPVLLIVSFTVFALMDLAPGDITSGWDLEGMTIEEIATLRAGMGLDDPLIVRYARYMYRLIQGDLGVGDFSGISVWENYITRLPNTLALTAATIIIGVSIAIPLGIFAARRAGRISDNITTAFTIVGMSMPNFWLAILIMLLFAYVLNWLPASGFNHGIRSLILPGISSAMVLLAVCSRQTRSSMLEVLKADYLRTARAKGVPEKRVIRKHALGNAMIPIVTMIGIHMAVAIAGTAVIETVFAWAGVGRLIVESVSARDVTTTTGAVILTTILYVLILLLVDVAYAFIDPRIRALYTTGRTKKSRKKKEISSKAMPKPQPSVTPESASAVSASAVSDSNAAAQGAEPEQRTISELLNNPAEDAALSEPQVSFITRTEFFVEHKESSAAKSGESAVRRHRKRSRIAEVFNHLIHNPGAVAGMVIIAGLLVLFVVSLAMPFEAVTAANVQYRFQAPSAQFPFGTDNMGRNTFLRVIYATRFSLPIGFGATAFAAIIGVLIGAFAAYYEGSVLEEIIMRLCDALASIPGMLLGMVIITTLGRSLPNLIIAIGVSAIPLFIRITRASVLSIKGNEFVEAAKAIGISEMRILYTQVLPNGLAPIIIVFTTSLGAAILISAGLSFLGFGIPIPNPEWGSLVAAGREQVRNAPWLTTFPGLFVMITVMGFNLLGDGLRDAFDPKLKK